MTDAVTDQPVLYSVADGVATIAFNRPQAMNSLDVATKLGLVDAVTEAAGDRAVRCVVLTGSGRAFCVGQDLKEHVGLLHSGSSDELFSTVPDHYNPIVTALATMPKPVVAAVNGVAAGAGASLAFACDFRLLADTAGFNLAFSGIALSCDTGSSGGARRSSCCTSRARFLPRRPSSWASPPASSPARTCRTRRGSSPGGSRTARPSPTAPSAARSPTPLGTTWSPRWPSRRR